MPYSNSVLAHCAACPRCGAWVVMHRDTSRAAGEGRTQIDCPNPDCEGCRFEIDNESARVFELDPALADLRYFYPSQLRTGNIIADT